MQNIVIAVAGEKCGHTPPMPYVGQRFEGSSFTQPCKDLLSAALLRCGFDTVDVSPAPLEPQELILRANRISADGAILVSYASFGSGRSFNDMGGAAVRYPGGRSGKASRVLGEDICAYLYMCGSCRSERDDALGGASCPTVAVDAGYLTNFNDGRSVFDPDRALAVAEHIALGVCEYFSLPYTVRDDMSAYPVFGSAPGGKRSRKIKLLQALLSVGGYPVEQDGIYGKNTEAAVKSLSEAMGAQNEGVGAALWRQLLLKDLSFLSLGSRLPSVIYLQKKLLSKLYKCPQTGVLDEGTIAAANAFLSDVGCETRLDGVDETVFKRLDSFPGKPRLF